MAEVVYVGEGIIAVVGNTQNLLAFGGGKELAFFVEELKRVPVLGIMRGRQNQAAARLLECYGKFGDDIETHAHKCADDYVDDHRA